jgi:hypothetical protein
VREPPRYIRESGIVGAPLSFKWSDKSDHIGPLEGGSAVDDEIFPIDHCGVVALGAALEEWAVWRFDGKIDTQRYLFQVDAIRAWPIHRLYFKGPREVEWVDEPPVDAAMSRIEDLAIGSASKKFIEFPAKLPMNQVHQTFVLRHVIPKASRKAFDAWFKVVVRRLAQFAPRPKEPMKEFDDYPDEAAYDLAQRPFFGAPVPPEIVDPDFEYESSMREPLLDKFLKSLDYKVNPFLRSPDELKEGGFEGTPYRLGKKR